MMLETRPFKTMRGLDLLIFVRDSLLDEAARKADFIASCEKVAGGATPPEDKQRVAALEAAATGLTFIIGVGQDELIRCKEDKRRAFPEWITRLANQARLALIADEPAEDDKPEG